MGRSKRKSKNDSKKIEKGLLAIFSLGLLGLGTYYVVERAKIARANESNVFVPPADANSGGISPGKHVICKGDKNDKVRILQSYLRYVKNEDLGVWGIDGHWGSATDKAVKRAIGNVDCFNQDYLDLMLEQYM